MLVVNACMVDLVSIYLIAESVLFPTLVKEPIAFF